MGGEHRCRRLIIARSGSYWPTATSWPRDAAGRNTRSGSGHGEELEPARGVSGRTVGGLAFDAGQPVGIGSNGTVAGGRGGDRPQRHRRTLAQAGADRRTPDGDRPHSLPRAASRRTARAAIPSKRPRKTQRDIQDLHGQMMHTLYVAAHGTAVVPRMTPRTFVSTSRSTIQLFQDGSEVAGRPTFCSERWLRSRLWASSSA